MALFVFLKYLFGLSIGYIFDNCHFFTEPITIINKSQTSVQIMCSQVFWMITYNNFFAFSVLAISEIISLVAALPIPLP